MRADDPYREVSFNVNTETGEARVVQGNEKKARPHPSVWQEAFPGDEKAWETPQHSHAVDPETGVTPEHQRFPSLAGGDVAEMETESRRAGNKPVTIRIDIVVERTVDGETIKMDDHLKVTYDPNARMPYTVDYPDPVTGERVQLERKTRGELAEWYSKRFKGRSADVGGPRSPDGDGSPPTSHAPGEDDRLFTPDEVGAAVETLGPARRGEATSGVLTRGPADGMTAQTVEDVRVLSELNEAVRRLNQGEDTAPIPMTPEALQQSNAGVENARQILANSRATPQEQIAAIRMLVERAIAEYRLDHMTGSKPLGLSYMLTSNDLRGMCQMGRDVSVEDIIALVGNSPHPITIERISAANLGIRVGTHPSARHGFAIITLADGTRFLVDPTFAQFTDQISGKTFTSEPMLSAVEGATLARDLLRDGFVPFTADAARQYVIGLGADPATAPEVAARLLSGDATILTEIVQHGRVQRSTERPDEAFNHMSTVSDPGMSPLITLRAVLARMSADDPRRPLLAGLATRLEGLATHMPSYLRLLPAPPAPP
jgi:hypothetical protein